MTAFVCCRRGNRKVGAVQRGPVTQALILSAVGGQDDLMCARRGE
jgi:hypothetical protein